MVVAPKILNYNYAIGKKQYFFYSFKHRIIDVDDHDHDDHGVKGRRRIKFNLMFMTVSNSNSSSSQKKIIIYFVFPFIQKEREKSFGKFIRPGTIWYGWRALPMSKMGNK